jgi:hypothetical protein
MIRELRSLGYRISRWNSRLRIVPSTSIFDPAMRWRSARQSGWRNWRLSWEIAWLTAGDVVDVVSSFPAIATFGKGPPLFASTPLELKQLFFSSFAECRPGLHCQRLDVCARPAWSSTEWLRHQNREKWLLRLDSPVPPDNAARSHASKQADYRVCVLGRLSLQRFLVPRL